MEKRFELLLHSTYMGGTVNVWTSTSVHKNLNTYTTHWSSGLDVNNIVIETHMIPEAIKNHEDVCRVVESAISIATAEKEDRVAVAVRKMLK